MYTTHYRNNKRRRLEENEDEDRYCYRMKESAFSEYLILLEEDEIVSWLEVFYPRCCVEIVHVPEENAVEIFLTLDIYNDVQKWDFKNDCDKRIDEYLKKKYDGDAKYEATPEQQRLLVEFGILTSKDSEKVSPRVLDSLLELDLGL